jgi:hypothetical protein
MTEITFFRQKRFDGGVRTGIDVMGETLLQEFVPGNLDFDSALLWYIDLRCKGQNIPGDPELVRSWFIRRSEFFKRELIKIANESLCVGFDADLFPYQNRLTDSEGTEIRVVITAIRRITALDLAEELRCLATEWDTILSNLRSPATVS